MASIFKRGRWVDADGKVCKKGTLGATLQKSRYWMVKYYIDGKPQFVKGYTDRQASEQLGAKLERAKAHGEQGLIDPYKDHRARPLAEHIDDYLADLRTLGRDDMYVYNIEKRLAKLLSLCGWTKLGDITADSFCRWREMPIEQQQVAGEDKRIGPNTLNQYLETLRTFCGWAVKRKRMATNPLVDVEKMDDSADIRRERRSLTPEQIASLLAVVPAHHRIVYRLILSTGLRRQEAMDLRWGDVRFGSSKSFLQLRAEATKNHRAAMQPLLSSVAAGLRRLRGDAGDNDSVFPSIPSIYIHRKYLAAAGIPWKDEDGRQADFHALRHTFGTLLSNAGVPPRVVMELMRHSDMRLTMKTYTDPCALDTVGAVEKLPLPTGDDSFAVSATGADGEIVDSARTFCVTYPQAEIGICSAAIGDYSIDATSDVTLVIGGNWQQKTPSGEEGVTSWGTRIRT
ncbi:MAG: site-specific integrase [Phycisphaerales bacterium]|nr:site-specific integrase [Phycisphaerales bacterium]